MATELVSIRRSEEDGKLTFRIWPPTDYDHRHFGVLIADFVRHVAQMYDVDEEHVWEWVERERNNSTQS